jgi:hypothetical protein
MPVKVEEGGNPPALLRGNEDLRPSPDPTILTTQQLNREMALLRELVDVKFAEANQQSIMRHEMLKVRLDGMDKAIGLVQSEADRLPSHVDEKIAALKEIHEEKFASIQTQFFERDVRTEHTSKDSKIAVDAALQAAKEAVAAQNSSNSIAIAKSETGTTKQIDQMGLLIQTGNKAADDKITDLKERITRLEGRDEGGTKIVAQQQSSGQLSIALIGVVFAIIFGLTGIGIALMKHGG